jgi:hypothetical protein
LTVALVGRDLLLGSRIAGAAARSGRELLRVDDPADLPEASSVELLFVDWADREPAWADQLSAYLANAPESQRPRLVLFGPHTDLEAHRDARNAGLGPMLSRSKLIATLTQLLSA